jgi:hypothetical protein
MEQIASYIAPIATTIAALIVASNLGSRITGFGFIVFTVGSIGWAALGLATGQPNLLWQNVLLTLLNLFGIWRWLGRQARIERGGEAAAEQSHHRPGENLFPVSALTKGQVLARDGTDIGRCVDAMAGCLTGRLAYVVVSEGGVGGVGETLRRLPWQGCHVADDRVQTSMEVGQLRHLEELEPDRWPAR